MKRALPADLEAADLVVGHAAGPRGSAARGPRISPRRAQVPAPGAGDVARLARAARRARVDDLERRVSSSGLGHARAGGGTAVAGEHRAQPVPGLEPPAVVDVAALAERLEVARPRRSGRRRTRAPATWARQHRSRSSPRRSMPASKPPSGGEQVGAHERAAAGHDEHVAHRVVLLLVELARARRAARRRRPCRPPRRPGAARGRRPSATSLGPTMPALERNASSTSVRTASGVEGHVVVAEAGRRRRPRRRRAPRWRPRRTRGCASRRRT